MSEYIKHLLGVDSVLVCAHLDLRLQIGGGIELMVDVLLST